MNKNIKKFDLYVFLSTFARNLIEVFIPLILYKNGYSLKEVIVYYLFVNLFSLILSYPCLMFAKRFNYRILSFIGIVAFSFMQIMLNNINYSMVYILSIAFVFALYRRCYWFSRRYYNLNVIGKKDISVSYTIICIINQLGVIISAYVGSILLDFINIKTVTVTSISLFVISIIPLFSVELKENKEHKEINLIKTMKNISFGNLYLFGSYELLNVIKFLFPLYLAIYVKDTYQTVGILNLITNLATLIFAYMYGKKINNNKNFLGLSIVLVVLIYIFKANTTTYWLILISFLEGVFTKMYEISINKEFYKLSKKFDYESYNLAYEFTQNFSRTIVTLLILLITNNLKVMIYIILLFMAIGIAIDFNCLDKKKIR